MTTPTTAAVPSAQPADLLFNAEKIDEAVNTSNLTYADRFGVQRMTLAGAMARIVAVNPRGAWVTATVYAPRDLVSNSGTWYIAVTNHTAGATFAGDLAANWRVYQGVISSDLSSTISPVQGAAMVGYSPLQSYTAGSIGHFLNFGFARTASEAAAGVTPAFYWFKPGDIRRYGAVAGGPAGANVTAIQAAINAQHRLWVCRGVFDTNADIDLIDYTVIEFESRAAVLRGNHAGAVLRGKNGTTERRYRIEIISGTITNTTRATSGGVAIDFESVTFGKVSYTEILEVETAVKNGGAGSVSAYYNEFHGVDISGVVTGYQNGKLGNAVGIHGGRINDCVNGVRDNENTGTYVSGTAVETFTGSAFLNGDAAATQGHRYMPSRIENGPVGFDIRPLAQFCRYDTPLMISVPDMVADTSTTKDIKGWTEEGLVLNSGTPLKHIARYTATIDFPSISAGASNDQAITIAGAMTSDMVFAVPADTIEAGLACSAVPGSGLHYVRLNNTTGSAINPASRTYSIVILRF